MLKPIISSLILLSTSSLYASETNQLSEHLDNKLINSQISNSNLHQSEIVVAQNKQLSDLDIDLKNTISNSSIKNESEVYQGLISIEGASSSTISFSIENIIENSTIDNSTVTQGTIYIGD
jgi:hypothetical protein